MQTTRKRVATYLHKVTKGKAVVNGVANKQHALSLLQFICKRYGWDRNHVKVRYTTMQVQHIATSNN
jgi:hypothetical protein